MAMECIRLNWLYKHMKKVWSSQTSILANCCTKLSKAQLFPRLMIKADKVKRLTAINLRNANDKINYGQLIYRVSSNKHPQRLLNFETVRCSAS